MIENKMKESAFIEQMMVVGPGRKFVSALIVPNFNHIKNHLKDDHPNIIVPATNEAIIKMPEVIQHFQEVLDKFNPLFSHPEQVKKFTLLPNEWTVDSGELTPSLKLKRKVIDQKYAQEIEAMYAEQPLS